jgi:GNAT superfamily N-acetyltransferase
MTIRPFTDADVDTAAELLARRHERHLAVEPLLPTAVDFRAQIEREWARQGASGVIADGGYLIGSVASNTNTGATRILVDLAGHAVEEPELARDLYAAAAERWVAQGQTSHAVVVPSFDRDVLDAWFRLAFGVQFAYAVRETAPQPAVDGGVTIRPGMPDDLEHVARFDWLLWDHQARSPSFSGNAVPPVEEFRAEWSDLWDDPDLYTHFVAERDGRVVGHALLYRRPAGDVRVPEANIDLAHAATEPDVRGSGAGLALTAHVLAWAHERGFRSMTTDWRSVNLLSSRFWLRRGWRETHYRLYRAVP